MYQLHIVSSGFNIRIILKIEKIEKQKLFKLEN